MRLLGKPQNTWGWVRIAGCAALVGVVLWTALAALLRSLGEVSWMAWSGYPAFSLLKGLELALVPLLAIIVAGWLEEQDLQTVAGQSAHHEAERAAAAQQKAVIKGFHEAVQAALADEPSYMPPAHMPAAQIPVQARTRLNELTQAALPALNGKGKGEILHFLYEKGLLAGESPLFNLNGADFRRAFLRHAHLPGAGLAGCDLSGAILEGANLQDADLRNTILNGAFLKKANLTNSALTSFPAADEDSRPNSVPGSLDQAILIETILPDGRTVTNEKGKEYLRNKELATLIDRL